MRQIDLTKAPPIPAGLTLATRRPELKWETPKLIVEVDVPLAGTPKQYRVGGPTPEMYEAAYLDVSILTILRLVRHINNDMGGDQPQLEELEEQLGYWVSGR